MERADVDRMVELARELPIMEERLKYLRSRAERMTAILDGMPRGSERSSIVEETAVRLTEELEALSAAYEELTQLRRRFDARLKAAAMNERERTVMKLRYRDGLSWKRIGGVLDVSMSRMFQLHRRASKKFYLAVQ